MHFLQNMEWVNARNLGYNSKFMKKALLYLSLITLLGSCYTTHVTTMVNEPAFEKAGEIKATATAGISHIQGQAAASITNHIGVLGGAYRGITGRRNTYIYNYGVNFYTPLSKSSNNTVSLTIGGSFGKHKGRSGVPYVGGHIYSSVNSRYYGNYMQMAYIYNGGLGNVNIKTAFLLKLERLRFSNYDVVFDYSNNKSGNTYRAQQNATNRTAMLFRPAISHIVQKNGSIFFMQIQYGVNIMRGFKIDETEAVDGYPYSGKDFSLFNHPQVFPLFFNIAFGIEI